MEHELVVSKPDPALGSYIWRCLVDGSREYSAHDLEGNLWSFDTYQPQQAT